MVCQLGLSLGCLGMKNGVCTVYGPEGVTRNMEKGSCVFKNIRSPKVGIYTTRESHRRNPLKASKAAQRAAAKG